MDKIQNRVEEHADYVKGQIGEEVWFVTALQGSQNYQMSDEHSDVDTKSIVIPSFRSLVFNDKRTSKTLEVAPTIEHSDVKDMREMINCWKKQNINFIEIIFTKWYTVTCYVYIIPLLSVSGQVSVTPRMMVFS